MARVDLVNVCKTLKDVGGSGLPLVAAMQDMIGVAGGGGRQSAFSIQNLNVMIPDGETVVVLGPSGCGKTTLLKIIAGLIAPDSGQVRYDGVDVNDVARAGGASAWSSRTTRSTRT
jgi:ABC-type sugar transport system ATPase subunit